jgi:hypothetical protein
VAVPAAVGLAVATLAPLRRRHAALVAGWWGSLAGVGTTVGLSTQRWSVALPLVALAFAIGVEAVWRVAARALTRRRQAAVLTVVVSGLVGSVVVWNVAYYFRDDHDLKVYSDVNTLVATEVGRELQHESPGTHVFMAAPPRMGYRTHNSIEWQAPDVIGADIAEPIESAAHVPDVLGPTVFVFLPERAAELVVVRQRYPGGVAAEVRWRDGQVLYVTYRVSPAPPS